MNIVTVTLCGCFYYVLKTGVNAVIQYWILVLPRLDANRETVKAIAFNKAHNRFLIKTSAARYGVRAALVFVSLRSPTDFLSLPPTSPLPEI